MYRKWDNAWLCVEFSLLSTRCYSRLWGGELPGGCRWVWAASLRERWRVFPALGYPKLWRCTWTQLHPFQLRRSRRLHLPLPARIYRLKKKKNLCSLIINCEVFTTHSILFCRRKLLRECGRMWVSAVSAWRKLPGLGQLLSVFVPRWFHRWEKVFFIAFFCLISEQLCCSFSADTPQDHVLFFHSDSAGALLCCYLSHTGLPARKHFIEYNIYIILYHVQRRDCSL